MLIHPAIHYQIEIGFLRCIGQGVRVEIHAVDFGNGFRKPAFTLFTEALTFRLDSLLVSRLDAFINYLILRNTVLPLCGQGVLRSMRAL